MWCWWDSHKPRTPRRRLRAHGSLEHASKVGGAVAGDRVPLHLAIKAKGDWDARASDAVVANSDVSEHAWVLVDPLVQQAQRLLASLCGGCGGLVKSITLCS